MHFLKSSLYIWKLIHPFIWTYYKNCNFHLLFLEGNFNFYHVAYLKLETDVLTFWNLIRNNILFWLQEHTATCNAADQNKVKVKIDKYRADTFLETLDGKQR